MEQPRLDCPLLCPFPTSRGFFRFHFMILVSRRERAETIILAIWLELQTLGSLLVLGHLAFWDHLAESPSFECSNGLENHWTLFVRKALTKIQGKFGFTISWNWSFIFRERPCNSTQAASVDGPIDLFLDSHKGGKIISISHRFTLIRPFVHVYVH